MLILTSFNSSMMPSCSSRKPDEPSPIPPTFSISMDVCKKRPKATATWLEDNKNKPNTFEEGKISDKE
jgi:hypothetical protein